MLFALAVVALFFVLLLADQDTPSYGRYQPNYPDPHYPASPGWGRSDYHQNPYRHDWWDPYRPPHGPPDPNRGFWQGFASALVLVLVVVVLVLFQFWMR
jgi:hypothetical protein